MKSEVLRIAGNYARLLAGFAIGILLVRQLLAYGQDIFNIFTIVTVGAGLGIMLRELLRITFVSRLTKAWRASDGTENPAVGSGASGFRATYTGAYLIALVTAFGGVALMLLLAANVGRLSIDPANEAAARHFIYARAAILFVTVGLSPTLVMLHVWQRFTTMNAIMTAERFLDLLSVFLPAFLLAAGGSGAAALTVYAIASAVLVCLLYGISAWRIIATDTALLTPGLSLQGNPATRDLWIAAAWSLGMIVSFNIYLRFDTFVVNLAFGATTTIAFGLAVQLVGMIRQMAGGVAAGLDAVAANYAQLPSQGEEYVRLRSASSYIQAMICGFAMVFLYFAVGDLLAIWVGDRGLPVDVLALAACLVLILMIGAVSISLSEAWYTSLIGLGQMDVFVRWLLLFALGNVIVVLALPEGMRSPIAIAWVYAGLISTVHLLIVPLQYARTAGLRLKELVAPVLAGLIPPLVAFAIAWAVFDQALVPTSPSLRIACAAGICAVSGLAGLAAGLFALRRSQLAA